MESPTLMEDSKVIEEKLYLCKGKEGTKIGTRDLIWAIGHKGKDGLDFNGLKSLFVKANKRGLFCPLLSTTSITWGEVQAKVELEVMQIEGDPFKLLDSVYTFYEIANFCYDAGVLTDKRGLELLETIHARGRESNQRGKGLLTLKDATETALPEARL